jgi:fucose 4-O-acetylase-like acetyltransferase
MQTIYENDDRLQSKVISLMRVPLAVLVVCCHSKLLFGIPTPTGRVVPQGSFAIGLQIFISEVIPHIAIPLFLFISGYLFFRHVDDFTFHVYKEKLKSRARSLILPYLLWCTIAYILQAIEGVCPISPLAFIQGLWDTSLWAPAHGGATAIVFTNLPVDMPLWFLRDLIVMVIFSPLVYLLARHTRWIGVAILGIWWFSHWIPKPGGFGVDTLFFFTAGACFGLRKLNFLSTTRKIAQWCIVPAAILMIADFFIVDHYFNELGRMNYNWPVFNSFLLTMILVTPHFFALLAEKWHIEPSAIGGNFSFFLYATHALFMVKLRTWLYSLLQPQSQFGWSGFYLFNIAILVTLCFLTYLLMRRLMPKVLSVLVGGRKEVVSYK